MKNIIRYLLFVLSGFAVFYVMYEMVNTELIYHLQQLGFSSSKAYFNEMMSFPGGPAEYLSVFLFQYAYNSFTGALLFSAILFVILSLTGFVLKGNRSALDGFLIFIPAALTAVLLVEYDLHPVFPLLVLSLLIFMSFFTAIIHAKRNTGLQIFSIILLFATFYWLAGGLIFLVFSLSALIWSVRELRGKRLLIISLTVTILAGVLPLIAPKFFFIGQKDAFLKLGPYFTDYKPDYLLYGVVFSLPFSLLMHSISRFKNIDFVGKIPFGRTKFLQNSFSLIVMGGLLAGMYFHIDQQQKFKIQVDKLAHERKWNEVLTMVGDRTINDRITQFHVNRALFFTDSLTTSLFKYDQRWGVDGLFLTRQFSNDMLLPSTELFFDLAFVNEAIHYANEALAQNEHSPLLIEQLILANIASADSQAARLYVNVLKDYPTFQQRARMYEKHLNGTTNPDLEDLIALKRELMPFTDFKVNRQEPSEDLINILIDKPKNRMAYEYLMSYFLLNNDLASFVKYYSIGRNFSYGKVPKVYQQALLLYSYELGRVGRPIGNLRIEKEIVQQFNEYLSIIAQNQGNMDAALPELSEKFGQTYWFYIHYNSPVTTTDKQ